MRVLSEEVRPLGQPQVAYQAACGSDEEVETDEVLRGCAEGGG